MSAVNYCTEELKMIKKIGQTKSKRRFLEDNLEDKKLFTKKELQAFGEFARDTAIAEKNKCSEITCDNKASICFECLSKEVKDGVKLGRTQTLENVKEKIKEVAGRYCKSWNDTEQLNKDLWVITESNEFTQEQKNEVLGEVAHIIGGHLIPELISQLEDDEVKR